jgi:hypothetical protein
MQRLSITRSLGFWALLLATTSVSHADITLFTNFSAGFGYNTGNGNFIGNFGDGNLYAETDSFTASATASLSSIDIALSCVFACPDPVTVSFARNSGGLPGAVLETFSVAGGSLPAFGSGGAPMVLNSVLHPLLTSGMEYWVTVAPDSNDSAAWGLNSTGDASVAYLSQDGGTTWDTTSTATPGALQVNGVPEPSTVILLGTVMPALALRIKAGNRWQLLRRR